MYLSDSLQAFFKKFNFDSDYDYLQNGKWVTNSCSNPEELFQNIVLKRKDIVDLRYITYHTDDYDTTYNNNWSEYDSQANGRCFTLKTLPEHGIKSIGLKLFVSSRIYIHTAGMMLGKANGMKQMKWIPHGSSNYLSINYEINELLDFAGKKCNFHKEYNKDLCTQKAIEDKSLEMIGCTTPFGPDKTKICKNQGPNHLLL